MNHPARSVVVLLAIFGLACPALAENASPPDFARDVQPIFKKHCYECHGADKHKNGYRLDRRSAWSSSRTALHTLAFDLLFVGTVAAAD